MNIAYLNLFIQKKKKNYIELYKENKFIQIL